MRILLLHSFYQHHGGEDSVYEQEKRMLIEHGHSVSAIVEHNDRIENINILKMGLKTIWSCEHFREIKQRIQEFQPDIAHFHNTFPLISPAGYYACFDEGIPVVQRLPNYRLICPSADLYRAGKICRDCIGRSLPWPGVVHACYRDSVLQSTGVGLMLAVHNLLNTWDEKIDGFIPLTDLGKNIFCEAGFSEEKLFVKPNFLYDPLEGNDYKRSTHQVFGLYVGRLDENKGFPTVLEAWGKTGAPNLVIIGDGPLRASAEALAQNHPNVRYLGTKPRREIFQWMIDSSFVVFSSECLETFGLVIIEAYATGTPVIAAKRGVPKDLVLNQKTGLHFEPGNATDLMIKVREIVETPELLQTLGNNARLEYEEKYTADRNHDRLMEIYQVILNK